MSKRLQITIDEDTYKKLEKLCNEGGCPKGWSKSFIICVAIHELYTIINNAECWNDWKSLITQIK